MDVQSPAPDVQSLKTRSSGQVSGLLHIPQKAAQSPGSSVGTSQEQAGAQATPKGLPMGHQTQAQKTWMET